MSRYYMRLYESKRLQISWILPLAFVTPRQYFPALTLLLNFPDFKKYFKKRLIFCELILLLNFLISQRVFFTRLILKLILCARFQGKREKTAVVGSTARRSVPGRTSECYFIICQKKILLKWTLCVNVVPPCVWKLQLSWEMHSRTWAIISLGTTKLGPRWGFNLMIDWLTHI